MKKTVAAILISLFLCQQLVLALAMTDLIDENTAIKVGELTEDEVWQGRVFLIGDVTVPLGRKLIIEPGTELIFDERDLLESGKRKDQCELIAFGTIETRASADKPIRLVSVSGLKAKKLVELGDEVRVIRFSPYQIDTESMKQEFRSFKYNYFIVWAVIYGMWVFARNI
ncbi:MAG: hypothetical protein JW782_06105 [Candidatus Saganbacteria bacterium]|nr:hypothetical protein [Candidatus Saganbacteria bacterium]